MYQADMYKCRFTINTPISCGQKKNMHFLTNLLKEQLKFLAKFYESRNEFSTIFYIVKPKTACLKLFLQNGFSIVLFLILRGL